MATLAELIKGFRHNVRSGYPSTMIFTGDKIFLSVDLKYPQGYIGICEKPSTKSSSKR